MADKLGLGSEVRELKLGSSFTNPKGLAYHTLRYDFKPASVDMNQMGALDIGTNGQVTVTVPPNNVFKGNVKPYQKQCVVVINMDTKEITLERLTSNIQVKKTRSERPPSSMPPTLPTLDQLVNQKGRKPGTSNGRNSKGAIGKVGGKMKTHHLAAAALSSVIPKHSPLHASPNRKSPNSTTRLSPNGPNSQNPASLSMIDLEDTFSESMFPNNDMARDRSLPHNARRNPPPPVDRSRPFKPEREMPRFERMEVVERPTKPPPPPPPPQEIIENGVGVLSDSSSSSSSGSSSSSDSSDNEEPPPQPPPPPPKHGAARGPTNSMRAPQAPHTLLREDLQLSSESGEEYD